MLPVRYEHNILIKGQAIHLTGLGALLGCEMLRAPHVLDKQLADERKFGSLTYRPRSTPKKLLFLVLISVGG